MTRYRSRRSVDAPLSRAILALSLFSAAACRQSDDTEPTVPPPPAPVNASLTGELGVGPVGGSGGTLLEQEPNDSPSQVQYVGGVGPGSEYAIRGSITDDGSDVFDGFRFETNAPVALQMELSFSEPTADLDFFLFDVAGGVTLATFETMSNPETGDYVFEFAGVEFDLIVLSFSGATDYELQVVGTAPEPVAVESAPPTAIQEATSIKSPDLAPRYLGAVRPMLPGRVVVLESEAVMNSPGRAQFLEREGLELASRTPDGTSIYRLNAAESAQLPNGRVGEFQGSLEHATARKAWLFSRRPGVRAASPDYLLQPHSDPSDTHYPLQWHYPQMKLPLAWDLEIGSSSVIVAVIDTGYTPHPDLLARLVGGYDFVSDMEAANDGNGMDPDATDPGDGQGSFPSSWHGTHVSGTVGACSNDQVGVAGVDWNCGIMSLRALGVGGGSSSDIAAAIRYAARLPNASGQLPVTKADVVNMSLGTPSFSSVLQAACQDAMNAGVTLIASAGNEPDNTPKYPAAFASVIAVGAVRYDKQLAPYSTYGSWIDIVAPGGDLGVDQNGDGYPDGVLSTFTDGEGSYFYAYQQGTSMAGPHVAGVAALLRGALPTATPAEIRELLRSTAQDLGAPGPDASFGYGLIDAYSALVAATAPRPIAASLLVEPRTIDFGSEGQDFEVSLSNSGGGFVSIEGAGVAYQDGAGWLSADLITAPAGGNISHATLRLSVERGGLALGSYGAVVTVTAEKQPPVTIDLLMSVGTETPPDYTVYVLVVDAESLETIEQDITDLAGEYDWKMPEVPPGGYLLVAGTDVNDDGFIGDEGEPLFGMWPSALDPVVLDVTEANQLEGLNFPVGGGSIGPMGAGGGAVYTRL